MYHLKNSNEDLVADLTKEIMAETDMCHCDKCRLDVMALALNHLPPAYVVTFKGELFANIEATDTSEPGGRHGCCYQGHRAGQVITQARLNHWQEIVAID